MINFEAIDQFYDAHVEATGFPPLDGIFNKQVLHPLTRLPLMVEQETGETLRPESIAEIISAGWIEPLPLTYEAECDTGFPSYIPGRVGLFFQLKRQGYSEAELRALVAYEEHLVDDILTTDELAYLYNDQELLIRHFQDRLVADNRLEVFYRDNPEWSALSVEEQQRQLVQIQERRYPLERNLRSVQSIDWTCLSIERRHKLGRLAYRVRQAEELSRMIMFEEARAKVEQGYSPCIHFRNSSGALGGEFVFDGVIWMASLYDAWVPEGDDYVPLRVPGLQLDGDRVIPHRMLIPSEYERLWKKFDLDEYARVVAQVRGETICQHCNRTLSASADNRKRYCDSRCRDAARSKRFRNRSPQRREI